MKKLFYIIPLLFGMALTSCYNDEIEQINNRLDAIENTTITSINEQIAAINEQIDQINEELLALESADEALQGQIDDLENSTSASDEALQGQIDDIENSTSASDEALQGQIDNLENSTSASDEALQGQIDDLKEQLNSAKQDITEAYQNAIALAILTNNGVIDEKIAAEIATVNEKITALETRLNSLEERISAVEDAIDQIKALDITFDATDNLACMAGASVEIGYTITGGDNKTAIEAWGNGGWSAIVILESVTTGKIKVTAPENATSGKVVVLATSGAGGVAMKSLHFTEGILSNIHNTYEVTWEACALNINIKTNLNYTINIPAEEQDWISIAQTRTAVRTETLTFSIAENPEEMHRSATIEVIGECGDILQQFDIIQKAAPVDGYIEFADKYAQLVCVEKFDTNGDGEISFKEADKVTTISGQFFGVYAGAIVSFDELQYFTNLTSIPSFSFYQCSNLECITLPNNVISIGRDAFHDCSNLKSIIIPNRITSIERSTFESCTNLNSVKLPNSITTIGANAFYHCTNLTNVVIPDSVTSIEDSAFAGCFELTSIVIGSGITQISRLALSYCPNLTTIYCKAIVPPSISSSTFENSYREPTIYVPTESVWLYQTTQWKSYAEYIVGYDFE